jgi:hypothetical protein
MQTKALALVNTIKLLSIMRFFGRFTHLPEWLSL